MALKQGLGWKFSIENEDIMLIENENFKPKMKTGSSENGCVLARGGVLLLLLLLVVVVATTTTTPTTSTTTPSPPTTHTPGSGTP